jgi:hypothetical protein
MNDDPWVMGVLEPFIAVIAVLLARRVLPKA